ncbi:uncharacterized protein HMPREF1541_04869 [Cyphellophora europaea CBS 101466]|uniref:5'-3' DNA helicase ZGRF1-like N-terminal domain-containing protein n=1 Tax=Cyphellophora europaea (strain CBS 101466) TaxID=1220924 RepID=W2RVW1_CYPE1|nr:uncharacterized protein HMPREF1541_04869 [Cyphellophora europaea CBS 101466]ETN40592.1 hypothetical protein HMPREF1541_04869 [Cyphellophora europaea CBS 101466]
MAPATAQGTRGAQVTPSNLPGPLSQATAPVLEFRCLYTRDVRKKAKKWHDGSLRYHTFNKRVMVYDDNKFYIGDAHYRQDGEVGEGTELLLDSHVMVEVGEPIGQTETDLNQVVHQRPSPQRPAVQRPPGIPRIAASQNKLKSIKDVLGASQCSVGRVRTPYQSPYDRRQVEQAVHSAEPPAKRQKTALGKENVPQSELAKPRSPKASVPEQQRRLVSPKPSRQLQPLKSTQNLVGRVEEVCDLSSDGEPVQPTRPKPVLQRSPQVQQEAKKRLRSPGAGPDTRLSSPKPMSAVQKPAGGSGKPKKLLSDRLHSLSAPRSHSAASNHSLPALNVYTARLGTTQLQFSREKPRRKLMSRALLPGSAVQDSGIRRHPPPESTRPPRLSSRTESGQNPDDGNSGEGESFESSIQPQRPPGPTNTHRQLEESQADVNTWYRNTRVENPNSPIQRRTSIDEADIASRSRRGSGNQIIDLTSSPLFVPQDVDAPMPPPSAEQRIESSQEFEVRMLEGTKPPGDTADEPIDLSPKPQSPSLVGFSTINISPIKHQRSPSPYSSRSSSPAFTDGPSRKTIQERMPPPPLPTLRPTPAPAPTELALYPSPSRSRPFRRTLSANDALQEDLETTVSASSSDDEFGGPSALLSDFPPTAALLQRDSPSVRRTSPSKARVPANIRRTLSEPVQVDSAAATTRTVSIKDVRGVNVEPIAEEPGEETTGPWTVDEAWLLFDVDAWPAAKKSLLPVWATAGNGHNATAQMRMGLSTGAGVSAAGLGGFGSARGVLERERTAQGIGRLRDEVAGVY